MLDLQSLADKFFYANRRRYTVRNGNIAYLDGSPLSRPFVMPLAQKIIALVIVVAALAIAFVFVNDTVFAGIRSAEKTEQAIRDNLDREASIATVPTMASIVNKSDDEIRASLQQSGYKVYDASSFDESEDLVLWKLPSDVNVDDAAFMISQGVGRLDAEQATRLLNGSWELEVDRTNGTSMVVHYVDFSTDDPQIAIRNALDAEDFDVNSVAESGTDESGNTFSTGSVDAEGTQCTWRISSLPLGDFYSISGMPEGGCYVGIRITVQ